MQTMFSSSQKLRRQCASSCSTSYNQARPLWRILCGRPRNVTRASLPDVFNLMDRELMDFDRQFVAMQRQMDRDMDMALSRARLMERQAESIRSSLREDLRQAPNVDIQRQEERGPGMYRYYERIQITSGGGRSLSYGALPAPAVSSVSTTTAPSIATPLLVSAMVTVGGYAALTTAFNRNYQLTTYAESKRWLLLLLWPLLVLFSPKFREQFVAAVQGRRVELKRDGSDGERK
ncbi:hypothetical protein Agub_g2663 [Astrephomene gubernaculifera]|uniref:Uncharacterized protein n=1 Tax=Astrephomene gubernaculifera TaxID=47775 RepID=A0AAD3DHF7_9CHLO|nr:hypothetical protein Agub_g2663 [Astrephomene gubernaculifera]